MRKIKIFVDDASCWEELTSNFSISRKRVDSTGEPYLEFIFGNILFESYIYGLNNTSELPNKIIKIIEEGCRPDYFFYDNELDEILLGIEISDTAPVGNALKQRIKRLLHFIHLKIPFIFVTPFVGIDNSQKKKRKITGTFNELQKTNPNSIIESKSFEISDILSKLVYNNHGYYINKSNLNFEKKGKSVPKFKNSPCHQIQNLKNNVCNDSEVFNVLEPKGNIYYIHGKSKTAEILGLSDNSIIIFGKYFKPNDTYSDPSIGNIYLVHYVKLFLKSPVKIFAINTHPTQKSIDILLKEKNKLTQALSLIDGIFCCELKQKKVFYDKKYVCRYKGDDESIATYVRVQDLLKEENKPSLINYPHGSWTSKDGKNSGKRDEKRGDIYYDKISKGEEGKIKLSDIYYAIEKYGDIHDFYYYLDEDCEIKKELKNKLLRVSF